VELDSEQVVNVPETRAEKRANGAQRATEMDTAATAATAATALYSIENSG
jgi:hypothetical protein